MRTQEEAAVLPVADMWAAAWMMSQGVRLVSTHEHKRWCYFDMDNSNGQAGEMLKRWLCGQNVVADVPTLLDCFRQCRSLMLAVKAR